LLTKIAIFIENKESHKLNTFEFSFFKISHFGQKKSKGSGAASN
jgi:hypothetical protein